MAKWDDRQWYESQFKTASDSLKKYGQPKEPNCIKRTISLIGGKKQNEFIVIEYFLNTKVYTENKSYAISFFFSPIIGFEKVFIIQVTSPIDWSLFEDLFSS